MSNAKSIFVIDDSNTALILMQYALKEAGYDVTVFQNIKQVMKHLKVQVPDMILLDLKLPDLSGFDFLKMQVDLGLQNTPILVVSAYDQEENMRTALEMGAKDFITKPIHIDLLLGKIKNIFNTSEFLNKNQTKY